VVVLFHAEVAGASGGFLGVSLFFTLSGFLITTLLLEEHDRTDTVSLRRFYLRRTRRLLPAAYVCLLLVALAGPWWTDQQLRSLPGDLVASVANVANWRFASGTTSYAELFTGAPSPVAHFWSLAIEEQVYLVLPILLVAALRRGRRVLGVTVAVALVASVAATLLTADRNLVYNGTHTRAAEVLIGVALALVMARRRTGDGGWRPIPGLTPVTAGLAACAFVGLVVGASVEQAWVYRGGLPVVGVLSALLIAAVVTGRLGVLDTPILVAIGTVSYGIYLFHWPVFLLLDADRTGLDGVALFALRVAVTAGVAAASFVLVEQPIRTGRRLGRPSALVPSVAAGAGLVVVAALVVVPRPGTTDTERVLALGADAVVEFETPAVPVAAARPTRDAGEGSSDPARAGMPGRELPPPPARRVLVVGSDRSPIGALAALDDTEVIDGVRPQCLLLPPRPEDCTPLAEHVAALRAVHDPAVVVISAGGGEADLAAAQNAAATDTATLEQLDVLHREAIDSILQVIDAASADGVTVVVSSATGKESPFYPRLARVALVRPSVGSVALSAADVGQRIAAGTAPGDAPVRLLVIGDSTSLSMAQAFNDGGDGRLAVLWAGANGCPLAPVVAVRSTPERPWREVDCEPYDVKLPPLVESFRPDAVFVMTGPLEQLEQRYPGTDAGFVAGAPEFRAARERTMQTLLDIVGPATPVLVADFPQIAVGEYAAPAMLDPVRLDVLNAQVAEWDERWEQVERFDYRGPLEAEEAVSGTLRSDGVHPDARQIEALTRSTFAPQLLQQIDALRARLGAGPVGG
jgi:peptidoglycan/LPS O-acetylase OafA/YrhL